MIGRRSLFPAVVAGVVVLLAACGGGGETSPSPSMAVSESAVVRTSVEPTAASTLKPDEQENVETAVEQYESFIAAYNVMMQSGGESSAETDARKFLVAHSEADTELANTAAAYRDLSIIVKGGSVIAWIEPVEVSLAQRRIVLNSCIDSSEVTFSENGGAYKPAEFPFQTEMAALRFDQGSWLIESFATEQVETCERQPA